MSRKAKNSEDALIKMLDMKMMKTSMLSSIERLLFLCLLQKISISKMKTAMIRKTLISRQFRASVLMTR